MSKITSEQVEAFVDLWNEEGPPLFPKCIAVTPIRKGHIKARLTDKPDLEYWRSIISKAKKVRWLNGTPYRGEGSGYYMTIDWLVRNDTNHLRVLEEVTHDPPKPTDTVVLPDWVCGACKERSVKHQGEICYVCKHERNVEQEPEQYERTRQAMRDFLEKKS